MTHLPRILVADAATCLLMGLFLVLLAQPLAPLLGLQPLLLEIAGAALLPIGAFIGCVATRPALTGWVVAGNVAWVAGSALLLLLARPTPLGYSFVIAQATVVALLAALEWIGLQKKRGLSRVCP